jgi:hypothetical protein
MPKSPNYSKTIGHNLYNIKFVFLITSKVNYALFLLLKSVVYIFYPKPYIIFR